MKKRMGMLLLVACHGGEAWTPAATRDTKDDPNQLRPGYGNAELHVWAPLEQTEIDALKGVERAKQGDMHALLALALVASGEHRDAASHAEYHARIDKFVADMTPTIQAADEWHKGYELNRAMHRVFFNGEKTDLGSYSLDQAFVTGIFTTGKYNCLSSAMLYAVLARGFNLPVRGVLLPEHAFIEMDADGGKKILEVETTSETGFDWVHDERYYKEEAQNWSSKRGLKPGTIDDYKNRNIVPLHRLMAHAMMDARIKPEDADRLLEIAVLVDPDDRDVQKNALYVYFKEGNDLYGRKAWRTLAKLIDTVNPVIETIAAKATDPKVLESVSWLHVYHARSLIVAGRPDEAIAISDEGLKKLDPKWEDYTKLRTAHLGILSDHLLELIDKKDFATAIKLITPRFDLCKSDESCRKNLIVIYHNQMVEHWNGGDHEAAKKALKECVELIPQASECADDLRELESRP